MIHSMQCTNGVSQIIMLFIWMFPLDRHYWKNSPVRPPCQFECKKRLLCDARSGRSHDRKHFCEGVETKIDEGNSKSWGAWFYRGLSVSWVYQSSKAKTLFDATHSFQIFGWTKNIASNSTQRAMNHSIRKQNTIFQKSRGMACMLVVYSCV